MVPCSCSARTSSHTRARLCRSRPVPELVQKQKFGVSLCRRQDRIGGAGRRNKSWPCGRRTPATGARSALNAARGFGFTQAIELPMKHQVFAPVGDLLRGAPLPDIADMSEDLASLCREIDRFRRATAQKNEQRAGMHIVVVFRVNRAILHCCACWTTPPKPRSVQFCPGTRLVVEFPLL